MTSPLYGESENRRVYIGDLNGGPGWTWTTDLALIRVARLGFTTTYKTAGTAKIRGSRTRHRMLWVGLWVGKLPGNGLESFFLRATTSRIGPATRANRGCCDLLARAKMTA